jgi:hypothetical protein
LSFIDSVPGLIQSARDFIQNIPNRIRSFVSRLPAQIGQAVLDALPGRGNPLQGVESTVRNVGNEGGIANRIANAIADGAEPVARTAGGPTINFEGGLGALFDRIEKSGDIDIP